MACTKPPDLSNPRNTHDETSYVKNIQRESPLELRGYLGAPDFIDIMGVVFPSLRVMQPTGARSVGEVIISEKGVGGAGSGPESN